MRKGAAFVVLCVLGSLWFKSTKNFFREIARRVWYTERL